MNQNLYALLQSRFPADRERPCFLLPGGGEVSYGALEAGAGRIAALLTERGVGPGDRVLVQAPKSVEVIMLYLACLQTWGFVLMFMAQHSLPHRLHSEGIAGRRGAG